MKQFFATLAFALISACLMLSGCATAPGAAEVTQIQTACAVDAGLRPTVTVLLAVPGLANVQDVAAITAARAVIDPICANPGGTPQANAIAILAGASGQLVGIVTQLQARQTALAK